MGGQCSHPLSRELGPTSRNVGGVCSGHNKKERNRAGEVWMYDKGERSCCPELERLERKCREIARKQGRSYPTIGKYLARIEIHKNLAQGEGQ